MKYKGAKGRERGIQLPPGKKKQKLRITSKNYQANKEKEKEKEKCKKEKHKKSQKEREEVLEAEPLLDNTHILNEKNSSLEM